MALLGVGIALRRVARAGQGTGVHSNGLEKTGNAGQRAGNGKISFALRSGGDARIRYGQRGRRVDKHEKRGRRNAKQDAARRQRTVWLREGRGRRWDAAAKDGVTMRRQWIA